MASSSIHLAIAKIYIKRYEVLNYKKVLKGAIYPDTVKDKSLSHFTDLDRGHDMITYLGSKVNLFSFLCEHSSMTAFEFGWFIHLFTDYLFFNDCFSKEYLLSVSHKDFRKDLYFAYDCLNDYIMEKYDISKCDYSSYPNKFFPGIPYQNCILSKELIDEFIGNVSSINLDDFVRKIKYSKKNIRPY